MGIRFPVIVTLFLRLNAQDIYFKFNCFDEAKRNFLFVFSIRSVFFCGGGGGGVYSGKYGKPYALVSNLSRAFKYNKKGN